MNKRIIAIGVILFIIAAVIFIVIISTPDKKNEEKEILEELTSDHLDEALYELDQVDFDLVS